MTKGRMTITDVAEKLGVTPKTIARWEKARKVGQPKRDWRGWRTYEIEDYRKLKTFKDTIIVVEEDKDEKEAYANKKS